MHQAKGMNHHILRRSWNVSLGPRVVAACLVLAGSALAADPPPPRAVAPFDAQAAREHQSAWARHLGVSVEQTNSQGQRLVLIPPGEFRMGSDPEQAAFAVAWLERIPRAAPGEAERIQNEEQPQHRVVLTRPFWLGQTEVTIGQFRRFVEATNYVTQTERFGGGNSKRTDETDPVKAKSLWHAPGYPVTDDVPVTQITFHDMTAYCQWLTERESSPAAASGARQAGGRYRLPTEAEWEYACRAGTTTHYSFGDDVKRLDDYAWFNRTAEVGGTIGARPVAMKRPNPFGLYDMHGNAWERCQDFFDPRAYQAAALENPSGPATGSNRMVRGGGWHYFDLHCRSAYRNNYSPLARTGNAGFRVVREIP